MRKVVLFIAMSLDSYIADVNGGVAWLAGDGSDCQNAGSYPEFIETVDTILWGYKTYHQVVAELTPGRWDYAGKQSYVFTHQDLPSTKEIIFTSQDPAAFVQQLKAEPGKDIWLCGGASMIHQLLGHRLIDKFCFNIIPTILGGGVSLFQPQDTAMKFR